MTLPLISIVVPTFNQAHFIEQTLVSILGQNYPRLELIVIDGGSTDGTAAVIEKYRASIAHYVSEKDGGQAEAINKGMRLARGDILAWLNSDDLYMPLTLQRVAALLADPKQPSLVYGGCLTFREGPAISHGYLPPPFDTERLAYDDFIYQASTFWTRALWEATGELDERCHYVLDWDWFVRASRVCAFTPLPQYLSLYRFHEAHKTSSGASRRTEEVLAHVQRYASADWAVAYRDFAHHWPALSARYERLRRLGLGRYRYWSFPLLRLKHGEKISAILRQLAV